MALTSVFYDGVATEADRAANIAGNPSYGVGGPDDFRVTAHPTIPYAVIVKAGTAHGRKLTDTAATDQVVQCTSPANGVVRWDCIVVRRNWQPILGGPSVLVPVSAGVNPVIPTTLKKNPGVEDDQPIFLVKWVGGTSAPTQFIDLRCWNGMGGAVIVHELAKGYLKEPGACVVLDKIPWQYLPVSNGLWDWVDMGGTSGSTANSVMRRDTANATSVGRILLTLAQSSDARSATRKDYVDAQVAKLATQSASGAMSANDKKKLDAASETSAANKIMMTDANGMINVRGPVETYHPASKYYADSVASAARTYAAGLGTNQATADTIVRRQSGGTFFVGTPTHADHPATKSYVDGLTPRKMASGGTSITTTLGSYFASVRVSLPAGFVAAPRVTAVITSNLGWPGQLINVVIINKESTHFDVKIFNVDGTPFTVTYAITVDWIAVLS